MTEKNEVTSNDVSFSVTVGDAEEVKNVELDNWVPSDMRLSPSKINLFLPMSPVILLSVHFETPRKTNPSFVSGVYGSRPVGNNFY